MKNALLCLLTLMLVLSANAQTQKRAGTQQSRPSPARTQRKLVETVRAQDGREVRLYDDMTYEVVDSPPRSQTGTIEVRVKAGVITGGGDVKAVARTEFVVFNDDIKPLLATVNDDEGKPLSIFSFYLAYRYRSSDNAQTYIAAMMKVKPTILGTFTTDFEGNGAIQVPRGDKPYYIFGYFDVGRSSCVWYYEFTPNKNASLILDNNNSVHCG